ncbi:HD domain-containing protein [[Eubacterium] cellulosolvens]
MKSDSIEQKILQFIAAVGKLKNLPRTGWREKAAINAPESVAEHMYRTAVISMILGDLERLDTEKILKMALIDDLPESVIGDLTPTQKKNLGLASVKRQEEKAIRQLLSLLPKTLSIEYLAIWKEAQSQRSREAKLVKSVDKLEMAIQAQEYKNQIHEPKSLDEFIKSAEKSMRIEIVKKIFRILKEKPKIFYGQS